MPTYHYRCRDCAHEFDQFQKFTEDPLTVCPSCAGSIRRVIHPVGVVFKGSGWYITDSRASTGSNGSGGDKAEKSEPAGKVNGKTAEKPSTSDKATAAKAEAKPAAAV